MSELWPAPNAKPLKIGDKVRCKFPPPPTWWDLLLWRLFRIRRKREPVWQDCVVTHSSDET
jgi:hypothetical protein